MEAIVPPTFLCLQPSSRELATQRCASCLNAVRVCGQVPLECACTCELDGVG